MAKLRSVEARSGYKLFLAYENGLAGEADLSHLAGKGVFAAWDDPVFFEAVSLGPHGEIRWSDDLELCADGIYLKITGKSPADIFPSLKTPADALP